MHTQFLEDHYLVFYRVHIKVFLSLSVLTFTYFMKYAVFPGGVVADNWRHLPAVQSSPRLLKPGTDREPLEVRRCYSPTIHISPHHLIEHPVALVMRCRGLRFSPRGH